MRSLVLAITLVLLLAGCGDGELSMTDYATQVETLLIAMNGRIDALDVEAGSQSSTLESTRTFWETKVVARREFIEGLESIEPPEEAAEMHGAALGIISRLKDADEAVAELVATEAVDEEAVALCQAAQAEFDSTADREVFGNTPWIPSELREVVVVAFGCSNEERGVAS